MDYTLKSINQTRFCIRPDLQPRQLTHDTKETELEETKTQNQGGVWKSQPLNTLPSKIINSK